MSVKADQLAQRHMERDTEREKGGKKWRILDDKKGERKNKDKGELSGFAWPRANIGV